MSTIPPNWLASPIQSAGAAQRAAEARDKDAAAQARSGSGPSFATELIDSVENSDRDGQVDSDAEGAGGQGKAHSEPDREDADAGGSRSDAGDAAGLDIQA